ncbi:MAG TPA: iron-only hydrogenase system regulator [Candidatus Anaerotruncus excrementipullorum]|uniref:Iron-only hydrogenase system regulator n=2 Tax=Oscillospiraceae TaxID=216572 RepID=A0A9D2MBT5_9FIRM|nr:iron-only hydrogenase system regulator [Candidatus Anaerotruncus excrementipullorum]HJB57290.1 iron-only hydrogenase system regulator [Candidatus Flavonifractor intestinipullorum]
MQATRIALLGIILDDPASVEALNALLHQYAPYIIGRMGIPYRPRQVNIISVVMDAPSDKISSLAGKVGMLPGVNIKTIYAKQSQEEPPCGN